jgi:DNA-binding transcriptional ArsR family regulator
MPLLVEPAPTGSLLRSSPSLPVELEWAMATTQRPDWARDHAGLDQVLRAAPDLTDRVARLWPEDDMALSCGGSLELMVLAHQGGLLFSTDAEEILGSLEGLARQSTRPPALASETEDDLRVIDERLRVLRESTRRRREYVRTISEVWAAVGPLWEAEGRPQVERAVARRRQLIGAGRTWTEVLGNDLPVHRDELAQLVSTMAADDELVIVPAFFTHLGLMVDFPGTLVLGVRVSPPDPRTATEGLARRLKAIADPTRLALVALLAQGPQTVTELAGRFEVAQPTMSNHVKLLREAGLVTSRAQGGRRQLFLSPAAADLLVTEFAELIAPS